MPVDELLKQIKDKGNIMDNNFEKILSRFGICKPPEITQIYRSAWHIGDDFVLKTNSNHAEFDKSIKLARLLLSEGIPVIEYIDTTDGEPYIFANDGDIIGLN